MIMCLSLFVTVVLQAQERILVDTCSSRFYFKIGSSELEHSQFGNGRRMHRLSDKLYHLHKDSQCKITSVIVSAGASPDGSQSFNEQLSRDRGEVTVDFLRRHPAFQGVDIERRALNVDWDGLLLEVEKDFSVPYRDEVMEIIRNTPEFIIKGGRLTSGRKQQLMALRGGVAWKYMFEHNFPQVRSSYIEIEYRYGLPEAGIDASSVPDASGFVKGELEVRDVLTNELLGRGKIGGAVRGEVHRVLWDDGTITVRGRVTGTSTGNVKGPVTATVFGKGHIDSDDPIFVSGEARATDSVELVGIDPDRLVAITGKVEGFVKVDGEAMQKIREALAKKKAERERLEAEERARREAEERARREAEERARREAEAAIPKEPKNFYMALKTNMLYDVLTVPNIGIEFYLGKGWSIGADGMYAWWDNAKRDRYWRIYGGDLTLRKYLGRRAAGKPLTGHHVGLYGQALIFDFERGGTGYMGGKPKSMLLDNMHWGAGVEYGYALPVGRRLNIDFTIGIGYLGGDFSEYKPMNGYYVIQSQKRRNWIGPTKAEISLVWLIGHGNYNEKQGRRR